MPEIETREIISSRQEIVRPSLEACLELSLLPDAAINPQSDQDLTADNRVTTLENLVNNPNDVDETAVVDLQKSIYDVVSGWHSDGKIDDNSYRLFAGEIFTDFASFLTKIQIPPVKIEVDPAEDVNRLLKQEDVAPEELLSMDMNGYLRNFLLGKQTSPEAIAKFNEKKLFSPVSFVSILESLRTNWTENTEKYMPEIIKRFVNSTDVDFIEPATPEGEMVSAAISVERDVSAFIDSCEKMPNCHLLDRTGLDQISEIYNPNNLLALAKEFSLDEQTGLGINEVCMIFRYVTILRVISNQYDFLAIQDQTLINDRQRDPRVGQRTWAGYLHHYGFDENIIDLTELKAFSDTSEDSESETAKVLERGSGVVYVDGVPVSIHHIVGRI